MVVVDIATGSHPSCASQRVCQPPYLNPVSRLDTIPDSHLYSKKGISTTRVSLSVAH